MTDLMRISATHLDSWRYFLSSETMTEQDFIDDLTGQRPRTLPMIRGTAFHLAMESVHANAYGTPEPAGVAWDEVAVELHNGDTTEYVETQRATVEVDRQQFTFVLSPLVGHFWAPEGDPEIKAVRGYPDLGFELVGKADVLGRNGTVYDYKTQDKALDVERYFDAWQWRTYLLLFGAERFVYSWWRVKPIKRGDKYNYLLIEHETFEQFSYGNLEADVLGVAADLADFRRSRGLLNLYKRTDAT